MKYILLAFLTSFCALNLSAQFTGDGYYRIRNVGSGRYITVADNTGSVNVGATSADLGAVQMFRSFDNVVSNPGSVLYVNEVNGLYRFESQGTDTHEIIGYDLKMKQKSDGSYLAYQEESFVRMYLCDARKEDTEEGVLSTRSDNTNYRDWEIIPLSSEGDNYFGITSELTCGDAGYSTLYVSFPFTFASSGMEAYYVSKVDGNIAVMSPVVDNAVPIAMPVIIKTASVTPGSNRVNIGDNSAVNPIDNRLGGVYFHNTSKSHNNLTPYDSETMRVLGLTSAGKLGFVKSDIEYLPANKAYLNVPVDAPDELELMTVAEYEAYINRTCVVNAVAEDGGMVVGAGTYKINTEVTLTASASEGYSFAGWSDGTDSNPYVFKVAGDVSLTALFVPNTYLVTYLLDGVKYETCEYLYGESVVAMPVPVKDGYTFSGWSGVPVTMPAGDVTITGSFTPNLYQVTYMVDGEVYKIDSVACDAFFKAEPVPTKEGYNFMGWDNVPAVMPAGDVVISGTFVVNKDNKFNLIYMVDGQEYKRVVVSFGDAIVLEAAPVKEGHTFGGWSDVPATMPLQDVTVTGEFTVNSYTLTFVVDGQVYATKTFEYGAFVVLMSAPVKDGYVFDGWADAPVKMPAHDVTVTATYADGIEDVVADKRVDVYTLQGVRVKVQVPLSALRNELSAGIYIVNGRKLVVR